MRMYIKLAWRNLWRNKRRSLIAGTAIGIGLASLIFVDALLIGMERNMVHSATSSYLGEGQIHRAGYRESGEVEQTIHNLDEVLRKLERDDRVLHVTRRVYSFSMITSPANVGAISLVGIDPRTEPYLSQIDEAVTEGQYFASDGAREIVIGSKLAEILEVGLGDRVVLTVARARSGDLAQEMFRISGIYFFNIDEMDRGMAFVRLEKAQELLGLENEVHEIAMLFTDSQYGWDKDHFIWNEYSAAGNEAVGWTVLLPQLEAAFSMSDFSTLILGIMLFGIVALGIVNTLFMSLHERMFEFGVLRAVGTRPRGMASLILLEAGALAVVSIILGCILGWGITLLFAKIGIDYTGIEFAGVTFRELLYPVLQFDQFIIFPFWVFVFTVVIGLYPALFAARMSPADAMRKSM